MKKQTKMILVAHPISDIEEIEEKDEWREKKGEEIQGLPRIVQIPVNVLRSNTQAFLDDMTLLLADLKTEISGYELNNIEISAVLTVSGKLSLLGAGGEIGGEGGIKFVFKKVE